jgi:hypothetical protein
MSPARPISSSARIVGSAGRAQRQDRVGVGIGVQIGHDPVLDLGRVLPAVDHLVAQFDAQTIGEALAALGRGGAGDVVVHA